MDEKDTAAMPSTKDPLATDSPVSESRTRRERRRCERHHRTQEYTANAGVTMYP